MTDAITIPITNPSALRHLWEFHGLTRAKDALDDHKDPRPPGFALASALVNVAFSAAQSEFSAEMLKETARAGYDISKTRKVSTLFQNGKPVILIEMLDLADEQ